MAPYYTMHRLRRPLNIYRRSTLTSSKRTVPHQNRQSKNIYWLAVGTKSRVPTRFMFAKQND